jgi:O-antigen ligase
MLFQPFVLTQYKVHNVGVVFWAQYLKCWLNFLLGVGTGDAKEELKKQNLKSGYTRVAELNMNAHHQFLNTHVAIGLFGLISLALSFFTAFHMGMRQQVIVLPILVTIIFLSLLTESFFETQAGIVPIAFFLSLIGSYQKSETE